MGGKSGGGSQVVGYRYFFSILMGLCRGPVNEVIEVRAGDRTAWTGSATGNGSVDISAPALFGGDDKEGGIVGPLALHMGAADQVLADGYASTTLAFGGQPSIGDTVSIGDAVFEFTAYVPPPPGGDGTGSEGGGDGADGGGEAEGG